MGVLEARANAEKITYPVVGEKTKDADNVIDYDIREEQTKDISAEINANNQTTTGMATVIPGVNAPKLIESTSIISSPTIGYIYAAFSFAGVSLNEGTASLLPYLSDQVGKPQYTKRSNRFIKMPADGVYKINLTFPDLSTSRYGISYRFFSDEKGEIEYEYPYNGDINSEHTLEFKKGELLSATCTVYKKDSSWTGTTSPRIYGEITRLG